ncbi:caspase domain-containing protein [Methylocystis sp. Sn-Cys]|uniref:caspase family protein n=1 Tax=Methylocystis sp. Sn-Cys TaxID=1701263 RepID=UPI0019213210|nr:caspase domain-containing protein [Methylocystis sp. Sn-Cys]MBL1257387.1 caspase family protein [Methylocystis sp. Sn-Cys]
MLRIRALLAAAAALLALAAGSGALAAERRLALVIGESAYPAKPLPTAANDAGLVAQTLQAAGFDVTGARDLDEAALKQAFRDFLDKAAAAGPDAVAFVYFSGYGLQLEGENYLVPVDAALARDVDIPMRTLRVSDYLKPLTASGAKLAVVALDAARANPFQLAGQPLAGGLALYEPGGRALLAYNAAPGTIAPGETGDYGAYAHALAEMIRDGGRPLMDVFENTRLRVSDVTKGAQIPWNSQRVDTDFLFFQREANAPVRSEDVARLAKPISALGPEAGFSAAIRRDTLQGYQDYVATYPAAPYAKRARAILAARREALTWRRSRVVDTPNAYWTYLRRYPKGPHAWDARRRLAELRYELEPPPRFAMIDYDYPPPPPDEIIYVEQPVVFFDDPMWGFAPPPPPPVYLLPPPPPDFVVLPPPVVIAEPYALPAPQYVPIPVWQRAPDYIAPPPDNFIYANAHNSVVVDPQANNVIVRKPGGGVISTETLTAAGVGAAAVAVGAALPNFIAKRNAIQPAGVAQPPVGAPGAIPTAPAPVAPAYVTPTPQAPGGTAGVPAGAAPAAPIGAAPLAPAPAAVAPNALPPAGSGAPNPNAPVGAPHGIGAPATLPAGPAGATSPGAQPLKDHALPLPPAAGGAAHDPNGAPQVGKPGAPLTPPPAAEGALKNQVLPTPAGAGAAGLGASEKAAPLSPPGGHTPAAAEMPGQALPARRNAAPGAAHQPEQLPSGREPIGGASGRHAPSPPVGSGGLPPLGGEPAGTVGDKPARGTPAIGPARGLDPSGAMAPHGPGPKNLAPGQPHPPAPQGVLGGPTAAPHRAIEPAHEPMMRGPAGGQPHMAPSPMREPPGGLRETAPRGAVPPMRAAPNDAMPPRPEGAAPHVRAAPPPGYGMPPQTHQIAPPAMHAPPPAPSPTPPAAFMRQPPAPPPQAAPPAPRPAAAPPHPQPNKEGPGPHGGGGGFGGPPPGFGGMH